MFSILKDIENRIADPVTFYFVLGFDFEEKKEYEEAINSWKKALKYLREDSEIRMIIYSKISNIYKLKGEYDKAIDWLERAGEIKKKLGHKEEIEDMLRFLYQKRI